MTKLSSLIRVLVFVLIAAVAVSSVQAQDGPKLVGAFFVKGKVGLKWNATSGASEYVIYRKTADTEFAKLGTTEKTNFFDTQLQSGVVFTYKIAAVVNGTEIEGNSKSVTMPAAIDSFSSPKDLAARVSDRGISIVLRWEKVKGAIAYNVLRSKTSGSGYEIIGNASTNRHTDMVDIVAGETYYYVVNAMNEEFEESSNSNEASVKYGLSKEEQKAFEQAESNIKLDSIKLEFAFEVTEAKGLQLIGPSGFDINSKGDIYIIDIGNSRIVCTDSKGKTKFTFGMKMDVEDKDDPEDGAFLSPFQVAIDKNDQVYVSDVVTGDIQMFTPDGKFIKRIKIPIEEGQQELRANGIDIFDDGRIMCTDVGNHRILIINTDGQILKEFKASDKFLAHFPNGVKIIDENSFVYTNAVLGKVVVSDMKGEEILSFGGAGTNMGSFGRAVGVYVSEDGLIWVTDAMGGSIQAFNQKGEIKIALKYDYFEDEKMQFIKPRAIVVKDGFIYVTNEKKNQFLAFKYTITKTEE